jgi:hypothetical protein
LKRKDDDATEDDAEEKAPPRNSCASDGSIQTRRSLTPHEMQDRGFYTGLHKYVHLVFLQSFFFGY